MRNLVFSFSVILVLLGAIFSSSFAEARFLQTDPIGTQDQMNLYNYVNNSPLSATDPTGMQTVCPDKHCRSAKAMRELLYTDPELAKNIGKGAGGVTLALAAIPAAAVCFGGGCETLAIGISVRAPAVAPLAAGATNMVNGVANPGSQQMVSSGVPLVLGLSSHGLKPAAAKIGGKHLMNLTPAQAETTVLSALADNSQQIVVRLDGFAGGTPKEKFANMVADGQLAVATGVTSERATAREMFFLSQSPRLAETTFMLADEIVKID